VKFPRAVPATDVIRALERLGFEVLRQSGSHIRMGKGSTRLTVPNHPAIATGTLKSILRQAGISLEELISSL
jgi:predicted RNA binding protein YcfA (HicA-like mRNA interferase family)